MKFKKTILRQILTIYLVLSFFLTLSIVIFFINYFYNYQVAQTHKLMMTLWKSMKEDFQKAMDFPYNEIYIHKITQNLANQLNSRVLILNAQKEVIFDYTPDSKALKNKDIQLSNYQIDNLMLSNLSDSLYHIKNQKVHISIFPVHFENKFLGFVISIEPLKQIYDPWYNFILQIIQISSVLFLIAFIIFIILSQNIVYPIKALTYLTKRIAKGDLDLPNIILSNNEIGELGYQMVEMAHKLKESFILTTKQNETLETMIDSIHQALWIVDINSKVVMANRNFKSLISNNSPENSFLWEVLRHPKIYNLIKHIQETNENLTMEVEINDRYFLCSTTLINSSRHIIFSLLDISSIKDIEKLKKDFVSNVSHELKTPLTTIKGFIETMMLDANEEQLHYLKVIDRNADRLINIVKDLLFLSKLEQRPSLDNEMIDICNIINNAITILKPQLIEKKVDVLIDCKVQKPLILGDAFKIEQVFVNLIDNAIKYAGKGIISISLKSNDNQLQIQVTDQGEGIPKQHLSRLFERFYVVDSSRSKRMGGTGLGLAIVKHIIQLHNGKINVSSSEGIGTTFTIYLPLA